MAPLTAPRLTHRNMKSLMACQGKLSFASDPPSDLGIAEIIKVEQALQEEDCWGAMDPTMQLILLSAGMV
jgi:hypothetical protein